MKAGCPKPIAPLHLSSRARVALEKLARRRRGTTDLGQLADDILASEHGRRELIA